MVEKIEVPDGDSRPPSKAIIIDIDGTLSNPNHRRHLVEGDNKDWEKFFEKAGEDPVKPEIRKIAERFWTGHKVIIVTGRPEKTMEGFDLRETTLDWLFDKMVPFDELYMRPEGDRRPDTEVKQEILDEKIGYSPENIRFAVDDRTSVAEMWRENGITCLQLEDQVKEE